jgi:predicted transcriptional regulator
MPDRSYSKKARRSGKGAEKLLGDLELAIMNIAWNRESVTVRDVLEALNQDRKRTLAYTTVMTVMGRLADKGLLAVEKRGKTYHYRPSQTREEFEAQMARNVVHSLLTDFGGEVVLNQFVRELSSVDPDRLARLEEMARLAQEDLGDE